MSRLPAVCCGFSTGFPRGLAMELALTGRRMGASEAATAGLVTRLVGVGSARLAAFQLAEEIAQKRPPEWQGR